MISQFFQSLSVYAVAILPWYVLGVIIAFFLEKKINKENIKSHFAKVSLNRLLTVQVLGMISPMSIMSLLPVANELIANGFNAGLLLSFFIAERVYDLQSFFIISGLFGVKFAVINFFAILLSLISTALFIKNEFVRFKVKNQKTHPGFWQRQIKLILLIAVGLILGSLLRTLIPPQQFAQYTKGSAHGFILAIFLGFFLYFGPILGNYPIAKAFSDLGMSQLGTFAFLTVSPILNIVVIAIFGATVGYKSTLKAFLVYSLSATLISLLLSPLY